MSHDVKHQYAVRMPRPPQLSIYLHHSVTPPSFPCRRTLRLVDHRLEQMRASFLVSRGLSPRVGSCCKVSIAAVAFLLNSFHGCNEFWAAAVLSSTLLIPTFPIRLPACQRYVEAIIKPLSPTLDPLASRVQGAPDALAWGSMWWLGFVCING